MEEKLGLLKKKLHASGDQQSPTLQKAALALLYEQFLHKEPSPLATTSPSFALLRSSLLHESFIVCESAIHYIVKLVRDQKLALKDGLATLLNAVPSFSRQSLTICIEAVIELLALDLERNGVEKSLLQVNPSSHPLVVIFQLRPESCHDIIYCLTLAHSKIAGANLLKILLPFLTFVFVDYSFSDGSQQIQSWLHSRVLRFARANPSLRQPLLKHLIALLPTYSLRSLTSHSFVLQSFEDLIDAVDIDAEKASPADELAKELFQHVLALLCQLRSSNQSIGLAIMLLELLGQKAPFVWLFPSMNLVLGWLLLGGSETEQGLVLSQLHRALDAAQLVSTSEHFRQLAVFLVFPLLQMLTSPSTLHSLQTSAASLLKKVDSVVGTTKSSGADQQRIVVTAFAEGAAFFDACRSAFTVFANSEQFLVQLLQSSSDPQPWLNRIQNTISKKDQLSDFALFLLAPFLLHQRASVRMAASNTIAAFARVAPLRGLALLPFLLYSLKCEQDPDVQLHLVYTIPSMGTTNPVCVGPVLQALLPLAKTPALHAVALRALTRLWERHERAFVKIQPLLAEYNSDLPEDVRISIASSIRDICDKKPQRGRDLVGILSTILKTDPHPAPVALALETLTTLCNEDVLDFQTAWSVISQQIADDLRPLVAVRVIAFLACGAAEAETEDEEQLAFLAQITQRLWNATQSRVPSVRKEAFSALAEYARVNVGVLDPSILPAQYVEALTDAYSEPRQACEGLIGQLLHFEVTNRRGIMKSDFVGNPSTALLSSLPGFLQELHKGASSASVRSALAGAILWSFQPSLSAKDAASAKTAPSIPRRILVAKAAAYRSALGELVTDISSRADPRDWMLRVLLIQAWISFMHSCAEACFQGEIARASLAGEELDERTAVERVCTELISELKKHCEGTPKAAEVSALALAALGLAIPSTNYSQIEHISTLLSELLRKGDHEWIQYGTVVGLGIITCALHTTDERFQSIVDILLQRLESNDNQWVRFGCALGLGFTASNLFKPQQGDLKPEGADANLVLFEKIINALLYHGHLDESKPKYDPSWSDVGCHLGLAYSAVAFEISGKHDVLKKLDAQLWSKIQQIGPSSAKDPNFLQVGAVLALNAIQSVLFRLDLLPAPELAQRIQHLIKLIDSLKKDADLTLDAAVCVGLGSCISGALTQGHTFEADQIASVVSQFIGVLAGSDGTLSIGALFGIANVLGAALVSPMILTPANVLNADYLSPALFSDQANFVLVERAISELKGVLSSSDQRLSRHAAWVLGSLSRPLPPTAFTTDNSLMLGLPDSSLVKALFLQLHKALKQSSPEEAPISAHQIESILRCLGPVKRLPPVRWDSFLLQLMKLNLGTNVRHECVRFALQRLQEPAILAMIDDWLEPARFSTLEEPLRQELYQAIPDLLVAFSSSRGRRLVADIFGNPQVLTQDHAAKLQKLRILDASLVKPSVPSPVLADLHQAVVDIFKLWDSPLAPQSGDPVSEHCTQLSALARCMRHLPKELLEATFSIQSDDAGLMAKVIFVSTDLVTSSHLPPTFLNKSRTWCISQPPGAYHTARSVMRFLVPALSRFAGADQAKWLLDTVDTLSLSRSPELALDLLVLISLIWCKTDASLLFLDQPEIKPHPSLLAYLLPHLFTTNQAFAPHREKVLQRLAALLENDALQPLRSVLLCTLHSLRQAASDSSPTKLWLHIHQILRS